MAPTTVWELPPNPHLTGTVTHAAVLCTSVLPAVTKATRYAGVKTSLTLLRHLFIGLLLNFNKRWWKALCWQHGKSKALLLQEVVSTDRVYLGLRSRCGATKHTSAVPQHQHSSPLSMWLLERPCSNSSRCCQLCWETGVGDLSPCRGLPGPACGERRQSSLKLRDHFTISSSCLPHCPAACSTCAAQQHLAVDTL